MSSSAAVKSADGVLEQQGLPIRRPGGARRQQHLQALSAQALDLSGTQGKVLPAPPQEAVQQGRGGNEVEDRRKLKRLCHAVMIYGIS